MAIRLCHGVISTRGLVRKFWNRNSDICRDSVGLCSSDSIKSCCLLRDFSDTGIQDQWIVSLV